MYVCRTLCVLIFIMHLNKFISNFGSRTILAERKLAQSPKRRWTSKRSSAGVYVYECVCVWVNIRVHTHNKKFMETGRAHLFLCSHYLSTQLHEHTRVLMKLHLYSLLFSWFSLVFCSPLCEHLTWKVSWKLHNWQVMLTMTGWHDIDIYENAGVCVRKVW